MTQPRDPFRREADAFRVLLMIFAAAAVVIAVTLLTRPLIGAIVGLVLLCVGVWRAWGLAREWWRATPPPE